MKRTVGAVALAAALAAGAAGCGSSESTLTRPQLQARANAICDAMRVDAQRLVRSTTAHMSAGTADHAQAVAQARSQAAAIAKRTSTALKALNPPEDVAEKWDAYLVARAVAAARQGQGRPTRVEHSRLGAASALAIKLADELGIRSC